MIPPTPSFPHYNAAPEALYTYRYRVWAVSSTVESVVSNTAAAGPDRVPPVLVPEHQDTLVFSDGTVIGLEFNENLEDGPPWSAFTVTVDGIPVQQGRVTTAQDQIRLTGFESPIGGGRVVRVSYRDPTPDDDPAAIQDAAGNDAASFTDVVVKNSSRVLPAPTNLRATGIDDTRIGLAWNAPDLSGLVWPEHLPGAGIYGYKIEASADGGTTWTTLVLTDNRATSYVHSGLTQGDVRHYRVSALNAGNFAGLPSNVAGAIASDTQPPALTGAATNAAGTEVSLEFDTTLQSGTGQSAPAHAFTVTADGVAMAVGTATTGTDTVVLSGFSPAIKQGQTVTVSYRDLTEGDDAAAIQDLAGNDVPSATDVPVTNNSTLAPTAPGAPRNLQARARGATQNRSRLGAAGRQRRARDRGLQDRGIHRWRCDPDGAGNRHRHPCHRVRPPPPDERRHAVLPGFCHQRRRHRPGVEQRHRQHGLGSRGACERRGCPGRRAPVGDLGRGGGGDRVYGAVDLGRGAVHALP